MYARVYLLVRYRSYVLYTVPKVGLVSSKGTMESPRGTQARLGSRLVDYSRARRRAAPLRRARTFPRSSRRPRIVNTRRGPALQQDGDASRLGIRGADPELRQELLQDHAKGRHVA